MNIDFNSIMEKAKDLAQTGVAKAKEFTDAAVDKGKELTEIGRLKVQNTSEQENIKKAYLELGKLYFAERGAAPEPAYAALCEKITASQAKIDYNNERIADMKAAGGLSDEDVADADIVECSCGCEDKQADAAKPEEPAGGCGCGDDKPQE